MTGPFARGAALAGMLLCLGLSEAGAQTPAAPEIGQAGKDVIWVPTPPELIDTMFSLAGVTPDDTVVDLGSGDGRLVIAAARRGAKARGVEFDGPLVRVAREAARASGVGGRATFVQGDMFAAPIDDASVLALFLLPSNLARLRDRFLALRPGTRIVVNTFEIPEWRPDAEASIPVCDPWCTARLWIVPARVAGTWRTPEGRLTLVQRYQDVAGVYETTAGLLPIREGRLRGDQLTFTVGTRPVTATVRGRRLAGTAAGREPWSAVRVR